ncbi:carbonic anhydrase [Streptomyces sp. NPDC050433]|uniref:carbonic anhydrase n=1 Tax=unclassified Streptomyces TaxID=2593676 RepID=UPI0034457031
MNLTPHAQLPEATSRRALLRASVATAAVATAAGSGLIAGSPASAATRTPTTHSKRPTTPAEALAELSTGNRRWRTFNQQHPHESQSVRQVLVSSQAPFAVVLGCIDSRVPPELVFDQGLGDLMTVRSAGEVLDDGVLGSVTYGVLELGVPLILVLGHQSCGAVRAAVHAEETGEPLPASLQYIAEQIKPAIDHSQEGDARVDATVSAQVGLVRSRLAAEPDLAAKVAAGKLEIVGARYELNTQLVHRIS